MQQRLSLRELIVCWCGFTVWVEHRGKLGPKLAPDTFEDEHNDMKVNPNVKGGGGGEGGDKTWTVLIFLWGVHGPFANRDDIIPETRREGSKEMGTDEDEKLQSQALKSLRKAAVAIFPLPTTYSQMSSLGYLVVSRRTKSQSLVDSSSPSISHPTSSKSPAKFFLHDKK